jgi:DNA-binding Lrp family transcriptional regulator
VSVEAIAWALNTDAVDNPTSKLVLIALANHARPDGRAAFPSITTMQRYTCLSDRAIQKHLRELEERGVIRRCNPEIVAAYIERADRRPIGYDLVMNGVNVVRERGEPDSPGKRHGVNAVRERGERRSPTGGTTFTQTVHEPSIKPSIPLPQPQANAESVCGGRGGIRKEEQEERKERALIFPEKLNAREKTEALKLLSQIDDPPAQEILDVLAAAIQAGEVRKSPLAVLRGLVSRSRDGTFDPTPGLHLATARERQRQFEAQTQQQVKAAQAELLKVQPPPPGMSGIEQLSATKRRLRGGYSNP